MGFFCLVCRQVLIKDEDLTEVCGRTNKHLRVSIRLYHVLLSNTSSVYIQVKQEDIETGSDGESQSEEYRIGTDTSTEPIMALRLLLELVLVDTNFLCLWTVSLLTSFNSHSSTGEFAGCRNWLRRFD